MRTHLIPRAASAARRAALSALLALLAAVPAAAQDPPSRLASTWQCNGGEVVWLSGNAVGCRFYFWGTSQLSQCAGNILIHIGSAPCWVCVNPANVADVMGGSWAAYTIGTHEATAQPADFSCAGCTGPPVPFDLWFPFDEGAGTNLSGDQNGNAAGTWMGSPVPVDGHVLGALWFNGTSSYVEVPHAPDQLVGTGDFSFDFWIRREPASRFGHSPERTSEVVPSIRVVLDKRSYSAGKYRGYHLAIMGDGRPVLQLANGGAGRGYLNYVGNFAIPLNSWEFVAVTVQRNDPQGIRWYHNGAFTNAFSSVPSNGSLDPAGTIPLLFGRANVGTQYLAGALDELEYFRRVLTPTEILDIYNANCFGKCR